MSAVVAGTAGGFLMASLFICAGSLMMFSLVNSPTPAFRLIFDRFPPGGVVLSIVALAYPIWGIVGAIMGILYIISVEQLPGRGLGSPNLAFTLAVVVVAVMTAAPFAVLLRQVIAGVIAIAVAFVGVFGWFLPYFAE